MKIQQWMNMHEEPTAARFIARTARLGAIPTATAWRGCVIAQVAAVEPRDEAWSRATHRRADAPRLTAPIRIALDDLGLERMSRCTRAFGATRLAKR